MYAAHACNTRVSFLALFACWVIAACGTPVGDATQGAGTPGQRLLYPTEVARIGDLFPRGLYRPWSMSTSAAGLVCVTDVGNQRVLVIDSDLELLAEVGSEGSGPGELRYPVSCVASAAGVSVLDNRLGRLSRFDFSGRVLETRPWTRPKVDALLLESGSILTSEPKLRFFEVQEPGMSAPEVTQLVQGDCEEAGSSGPRGANAFRSPSGSRVVLTRRYECGRSNHTLVVRVSLAAGQSETHRLAVYGEFRTRRESVLQGRGIVRTVVLQGAATDGERDYVVHAFQKRVADDYLTALDVFGSDLQQPERVYVALPANEFARPRLTLMTTTLTKDLLILDEGNEVLLRFSNQAINGALGSES